MLTVEERPFQRVTKMLLGEKSVLKPVLSYLPSPPPEGEDELPLHDPARVQRFREDVLLDFANLESSIVRIQLILSSNERERERYAAEKAKILETAQAVRENTLELRSHLQEAQQVLERRKGYDEMAIKILDDRKLKSRDEARADIEKLEKEIEDLKQESADYEGTWLSRREQFDAVVREGEAMVRQIKGIKDEPEPEKDDNMDDAEDGTKEETSGRNTPIQDGRSPHPTDGGDATPLPESGEYGTPARPSNKFLDVEDSTRPGSRVSSPLAQPASLPDDVDMAETPLAGEESGDAKVDENVEASAEPTAAATPSADVAETMDET